MKRRLLQFSAPIDLQCASCGKVGVLVSVVFPVEYGIEAKDGAQFSTPSLDLPVRLTCRHCLQVVNYGPVGRIVEGNLERHDAESEAPAEDSAEADDHERGSEDDAVGPG